MMSRTERPAFRRPREGDLEKGLRPEYKAYEEWRTAQMGEAPEAGAEKKEEPKKFRFGRMDLILIILGAVAGLIWQSCKPAP